jgi:hypothetical protein
MLYSSCEFLLLLLASLLNVFGGMECAGHSFAYVAHLVFFRHVWIRTQRATAANRRTVNLVTHLPILATHLPCLATHLPAESYRLLLASLLLLPLHLMLMVPVHVVVGLPCMLLPTSLILLVTNHCSVHKASAAQD